MRHFCPGDELSVAELLSRSFQNQVWKSLLPAYLAKTNLVYTNNNPAIQNINIKVILNV